MSTANPLSPTLPAIPGALRGGARLELHTHHAAYLVSGRRGGKRPQILGLHDFCRLVNPIWAAASRNDPYADWWLLKIEKRLWMTERVFEQSELAVEISQFPKPRLELLPPESKAPIVASLTVANPLAYQAAGLLATFDATVAMLLAARHVSLMKHNAIEGYVREATRCMRAVFCSPGGYINYQISRADVRAQSGMAMVADEAMPGLPADVLSGASRSVNHPLVREAESATPVDSEPHIGGHQVVATDHHKNNLPDVDDVPTSLPVAETARRLEAPITFTPPCPKGVSQ